MNKSESIQLLSSIAINTTGVFIPLMAMEMGASDFEIGIIGAIYGVAIFFSSYIFGRASDVYGRRMFLYAGLLLTGATMPLHLAALYMQAPLALALVRWASGFCAGIFPAALMAHLYESKGNLARFIAYGPLGAAVGSFLAGIIAGYFEIFTLSTAMFFAAFAIALFMDLKEKEAKDAAVQSKKYAFKEDVKKNMPVYLPFLVRHIGATAAWVVFPLYVYSLGGNSSPLSFSALGASVSLGGKFWVGVINATNLGTQFVLMSYLNKYNTSRMVPIGLVLSALSFITFILATDYMQLIPLQFLLAAAYSFLYVGTVRYGMEGSTERASSAGVFNSTFYLASMIGPFLGGIIAELYGYKATFGFALVMAVAAYAIFRILIKSVGGGVEGASPSA